MREFSMAAIACVVLCEACRRCDAIIQSRARLGIDARRKHECSLALVQGYQMAQALQATRPKVRYECNLTLVAHAECRNE